METSFTDVEKRFVLAEMIKASHMDVRTLVEFIRNHNLQPDWLEMQLPMGRNMHQCLRAAESMFNMHIPPPPMPPLKRKSIDDLNEYMPAKRQAALSPVEPQVFQPSRSFGVPPLSALSQPVNIQPRPSPNGHVTSPGAPPSASSASSMMAFPAAQTARKRGRPSKAEMEARARQRASHSTHNYTPIKAAPVAIPVATAPHAYSPRPSPMSAYQISGSGQSDTRPKTTESLSPGEKFAAPEAVPRPVQGPPGLKSEPGPPPGPGRGSVPRSARDLGPPGLGPSPGPGPGLGPGSGPSPGPGQGANSSHHAGATTPGLGANSASQARNESPMSVAS